MNIQKYMAFVKTVEFGSFTRAAEVLNYSQSGISRMINDLEREWKLSLLERSRAGVHLTSDGLKLLPFAKTLCHDYTKLQMQIDELNGLQSGIIRIGTFSSVATHWLPPMIQRFQAQYPNIEYELLLGDYTEIEDWILEGRVDFGFLRIPANRQLDTVFIGQDRLLVILPENHPLADCERFPVSALSDDPFMLLERGANTEVAEILEQLGVRPKIQFTAWDDGAIMSMVESGLGISILHELVLQRIPYRIVAKELEVPAYRKIGIAMHDSQSLPLAVKTFLEYLPFRNHSMEE